MMAPSMMSRRENCGNQRGRAWGLTDVFYIVAGVARMRAATRGSSTALRGNGAAGGFGEEEHAHTPRLVAGEDGDAEAEGADGVPRDAVEDPVVAGEDDCDGHEERHAERPQL